MTRRAGLLTPRPPILRFEIWKRLLAGLCPFRLCAEMTLPEPSNFTPGLFEQGQQLGFTRLVLLDNLTVLNLQFSYPLDSPAMQAPKRVGACTQGNVVTLAEADLLEIEGVCAAR